MVRRDHSYQEFKLLRRELAFPFDYFSTSHELVPIFALSFGLGGGIGRIFQVRII